MTLCVALHAESETTASAATAGAGTGAGTVTAEQQRAYDASTTAADSFAAEFGCSSRVLADTLIPSTSMCGRRFDLKIDDQVFVGHPCSVDVGGEGHENGARREETNTLVFNVVFVLKGCVSKAAIASYHSLALQLSAALQHEEARSGYFQAELHIMMDVHETNPNVPIDSPDHAISTILAGENARWSNDRGFSRGH